MVLKTDLNMNRDLRGFEGLSHTKLRRLSESIPATAGIAALVELMRV